MNRTLSQSALVSTSTASASPPRPKPSAAAFWNNVSSTAPVSPSPSVSAAATVVVVAAAAAAARKRSASRRRGGLCVCASSAVASPPPPAASSSMSSMMGTGSDLGEVTAIHGPEELDAVLASSPSDSVVVLMAKSAGCRPCKAFARKYARIAGLYGGVDGSDGGDGGDVSGKKNGATFLVVTGDESKETRAMMMAMKVRVTPTFFIYKNRALFKTTTGVNENNLKAAIDEAGGRAGGGGGGGSNGNGSSANSGVAETAAA